VSLRHAQAGEAFFESVQPYPVHWHRVMSMAATPSRWGADAIRADLALVRLHRAYELCRLGFVLSAECWTTGPQGDQPQHQRARRMLRDGERLLRRALAEVTHGR